MSDNIHYVKFQHSTSFYFVVFYINVWAFSFLACVMCVCACVHVCVCMCALCVYVCMHLYFLGRFVSHQNIYDYLYQNLPFPQVYYNYPLSSIILYCTPTHAYAHLRTPTDIHTMQTHNSIDLLGILGSLPCINSYQQLLQLLSTIILILDNTQLLLVAARWLFLLL